MKNYLAVKKVKAIDDYQLIITFSNDEKRIFDMKPFLSKGIFKELRNIELFKSAHVCFDTIEWDNEADLDPEILYSRSKKISNRKYTVTKPDMLHAAEKKSSYK
ncbi:MAG: DUF2442 domain-containing protein [Bacteroidota bacterium]